MLRTITKDTRYKHILRFPMSKLVVEIFKHEGFIRKRINEFRKKQVKWKH